MVPKVSLKILNTASSIAMVKTDRITTKAPRILVQRGMSPNQTIWMTYATAMSMLLVTETTPADSNLQRKIISIRQWHIRYWVCNFLSTNQKDWSNLSSNWLTWEQQLINIDPRAQRHQPIRHKPETFNKSIALHSSCKCYVNIVKNPPSMMRI